MGHMKTISIRELHARTGAWVREAERAGEIAITDRGRVVARILPAAGLGSVPYFARRRLLPEYQAFEGTLGGGTDSTDIVSDDRGS
jgi:prevent-host-death family protein